MLVSIDLGYGYTKAYSEKARVLFPSVIGPAEEGLDYGRSFGYQLKFRKPGEAKMRELFIGELAQKSGRAAQVSLSRDKFAKEASAVLALAAAYLAGAEGQTDVALGLPVAYFKLQSEEIKRLFSGVSAYVAVDDQDASYISFNKIHVFPQAVGVLYSLDQLPKQGLVGVIDVGFYTTDFLLVECTESDIAPLRGYSNSIESGVSTALKLFSNRFTQRHGAPLTLSEAHDLWLSRREKVRFRGKPVDVGSLMEAAERDAAQAIGEAVLANWSEKADWVDTVYLSGGDAERFTPQLKTTFPQIHVVDSPQFANALGFYKLAGGCIHPESQAPQELKVVKTG